MFTSHDTPEGAPRGVDLGQFNRDGVVVLGRSTTDKFLAFDRRNPGFQPLLVQLAEAFIAATGRRHCGIQRLVEVARHDIDMAMAGADEFKVNNDYAAFYARKMMAENPDLLGFFDLRYAPEADAWLWTNYPADVVKAVLRIKDEVAA